jgi:hypothetical protein
MSFNIDEYQIKWCISDIEIIVEKGYTKDQAIEILKILEQRGYRYEISEVVECLSYIGKNIEKLK